MTTEPASAERYLSRLGQALAGLPRPEVQEILSDLRSLLLESADQGQELAAVLARLGPPEVLAETYRTERILSAAVHTSAPLAVLSALLRWAVLGLGGFLGSVALFIGYAFAAALLIVCLLKPVFPNNVGFWPHSGSFGALWPRPAGAEVLGYWIIPICLSAGVLLYSLTSWAMRRLLGTVRRHLALPLARRA